MQNIHWYISDIADVPGNNGWLSKNEKKILVNLRFLKRRYEWRLGRWTAKNAFLSFKAFAKNIPLSEIEILSKESGAPFLQVSTTKSSTLLSISHRADKAVCILSESVNAIGCDLELIEPRSDAFINDYFSEDEKKHIDDFGEKQRDIVSNLIWSAKESTLKVLEVGLNMDPRAINLSAIEVDGKSEWKNLQIKVKNLTTFYGRWLRLENYLLTIVSSEKFSLPVKM